MNKRNSILMVSMVLALSACSGIRDVEHKWCPPESTPVAVPAAQTEQFNLAADALFRFDKASSTDLLPAGKATLDKLVDTLARNYVQVNGIELIGHTDRLGKAQYNDSLGLRRAQTVKAYLQNKGVTTPITVGSKGESEPVSHCEGTKATAELKACLQPDRRVEVKVTGIRKARK